jgi:uncharacterized protein
MINVKPSPGRGRGVFAQASFDGGDTIEVCPTIHFGEEETKLVYETDLKRFLYDWHSEKASVIALGYGSLYNHAYVPNAVFDLNYWDETIVIRAIKYIDIGEEISSTTTGTNSTRRHCPILTRNRR